MSRRFFIHSFAALILLIGSSAAAMAQIGQLRGHVVFKASDGTTTRPADALIDVFRTDQKGDWHTKTDKHGEFVFAGLPYVGVYVVGVSLPNAEAYYKGNVRAGRDIDYEFELGPGDGHRLTFDEIKTLLARTPGANGETSSGGESAEVKAKREELNKKNEEIKAGNKKIEEANAAINKAYTAGNAALQAKPPNYDEAIKDYDEGLAADPDHPGAPALLTNKSIALRARGVNTFNASIKLTDDAAKNSAQESAKKDWKDSAEAASKAVELLKKQPAPTDPNDIKTLTQSKYLALMARKEAMRFVVSKVDTTQVDPTVAAYQEYLEVETDAAKKTQGQHDLAQALFDASAYDKAKAEYEKILSANPDDPDALANMGLILYNQGFAKESEGNKDAAKASYQEAANYLQKFIDKAPENHRFKADAQAVLENLKNQQNVQAEKTTTPKRGRRP